MDPRQNITLVAFGGIDKKILKELIVSIQNEFKIGVNMKEVHVDLSVYFDAGRRQYNANDLLKMVESTVKTEEQKVIGIFNVDLFIPILTYIFGQAILKGNYGVASYYRLQNERYGLPADSKLLNERLKKEVIHELGHSFGLIHCHYPGCVMQSSTYVEDIDLKTPHFCPNCRALI